MDALKQHKDELLGGGTKGYKSLSESVKHSTYAMYSPSLDRFHKRPTKRPRAFGFISRTPFFIGEQGESCPEQIPKSGDYQRRVGQARPPNGRFGLRRTSC
jgi:hypothetical protein